MIPKYFSKQFAAISTSVVLLTASHSALAEIITLTFDITNIDYYQRDFNSDTGVLAKDFPEDIPTRVSSESLTVQLDTSTLTPVLEHIEMPVQNNPAFTEGGWVFLDRNWHYHTTGSNFGELSLATTPLTFSNMTSTLGLADAFRNKDPLYRSSKFENKALAQQSYSDYTESSGFSDAADKYDSFQKTATSYDYVEETGMIKNFDFIESLNFDIVNNIQSLNDPELYTLDNILKDIYLTTGSYELSHNDEIYTYVDNLDGSYDSMMYKAVGEWYYGDVNLASINGIDADEYFSQIPTPTSITMLALALLGLRVTRSKH